MKSIAITGVATIVAVVVVLSTRLVIPAFIVLFRAIEAGFAPDETVEALPVAVSEPSRTTTRKRGTATSKTGTATSKAGTTTSNTAATAKRTTRRRTTKKANQPISVGAVAVGGAA